MKKNNEENRFERIYKEIRQEICLLHFPPGTILNESKLAQRFKISRTPLRPVLQKLKHEGLVTIKNGVGTIVTGIDMKELKDIYDIRMMLIGTIDNFSTNIIQPIHIKEIENIIKQAKLLFKNKNAIKYAILCNKLEDIILNLISNEPLREITDILYYRVARIWFTFLPNMNWEHVIKIFLKELNEVLIALKKNDIKKLGIVRKKALQNILDDISEFIAKS